MDTGGAYAIASMAKECVYDIRVSLVGDSDVGKTSISMSFRGEDIHRPRPTVGCDFGTAYKKYANGDCVRYVIVDTAGQERYSYSLPNYIRDSDAVVVVYDITDKDSFENIDRWLKVIHTRLACDVPTILVGNKCDKNDERDVKYTEGKSKAERHNMFFTESSALSGHHIHYIFEHLATEIRDRKLNELFHGVKTPLSSMAFRLPAGQAMPKEESNSKCCSIC